VRALHTTDLEDSSLDARSPQVQPVLRALQALIDRPRDLPSTTTSSRPASSAPDRGAGRVAICVLPFANMSGDAEQEYFSDGITEDIITDLSKVSALSVISRNSAFVFKGRHVDVPKVARELKVSHVLEGSVRKAGGRVRITAQLVDASSNDHVWAERFDRDLNDIFALQDEISEAIVRALKVKLLPAEKQAIAQRGTDNVEAYNLYLRARQYFVHGHAYHARPAEAIVRLCIRATEIDPGYARAWALLAIAQRILHYHLGKGGDDGLVAAERALALDAGLAEAHVAKSRILADKGRRDEANAEIDIALRLDPQSYEANRSAGSLRYQERRFEDAIRYFEKAMHLMETDFHAASMLSACYKAVGNTEASRRTTQLTLSRAERAVAQDQNDGAAIAVGATALVALGEVERAREWMNQAELIDPDNVNARYNFACALSSDLNDTGAALEFLGPIFATMTASYLRMIKSDPDLDPLRDDPRFMSMLAAAEARLAGAPL
jgi:adenylate cyclase